MTTKTRKDQLRAGLFFRIFPGFLRSAVNAGHIRKI